MGELPFHSDLPMCVSLHTHTRTHKGVLGRVWDPPQRETEAQVCSRGWGWGWGWGWDGYRQASSQSTARRRHCLVLPRQTERKVKRYLFFQGNCSLQLSFTFFLPFCFLFVLSFILSFFVSFFLLWKMTSIIYNMKIL